jgi:hypothetical protein
MMQIRDTSLSRNKFGMKLYYSSGNNRKLSTEDISDSSMMTMLGAWTYLMLTSQILGVKSIYTLRRITYPRGIHRVLH